jgi:hypothetical protein
MKTIPLTKGKVAIVDDADYERLRQYSWSARKPKGYWYAARWRRSNEPPGSCIILMHRFLLDAPAGVLVDHRDGDGLNNRRSNIRTATHSQNSHNRKMHVTNTSGFKGVVRNNKRGRPWLARIALNRRQMYIGVFDTPEEAARAYDRKAKELHGEFARLNFPE